MDILKLMNSEFNGGENTRELREYLFQFQNAYRKKDNQRIIIERNLVSKENELVKLRKDNLRLKDENLKLKKENKFLKTKKLSLKERILGKIKN